MAGRPTKLTPEVQDRMCALIRAGNTTEIAAQAVGINRSTYVNWMGRDRMPYLAFRAAVEQARGEAEATLVTRIAKAAANGSWPAAAWLLERRYSERWAKITERRLAEQDDEKPKDPFEEYDELADRRLQRTGT